MSQNIGVQVLNNGGTQSALNVTAAKVIKNAPGRIARVTVVAAGSGGNLVLNDCLTTGAAAAANEIISLANASLTVGAIFDLEWPCLTGIVVSAVPTGTPQISISFT